MNITVKDKLEKLTFVLLVLYSFPIFLVIEILHLFNFTVGKMTYGKNSDGPKIEWLNDSSSRKQFWGACALISTVIYFFILIF